jgi:WD40 repeat protein
LPTCGPKYALFSGRTYASGERAMTEREIFIAALHQREPGARAAFLDRACGEDRDLRAQVEELLREQEHLGSFLEEPAGDFPEGPAPPPPTEEPGAPAAPGATKTGPAAEDDGAGLDFLAPSDRPDSLGRLGHYEVLGVIGRGGMGVVLRAFDQQLHRVVAIKVMGAQLATNATARRRFAREAQAQAAVSHDHVVAIHAVEEAGSLPYLVMQYVAGRSLQERLDRGGPLEAHEVLRIGMQTAAGLAAAHAQGLIHRDVKPANILLENGVERVKLTDFGLARAADDASLTQSGMIAGTPQYMSPEQAESSSVDARSDLFSLGSVLYALCTGRPPFRAAGSMAVLRRVCDEAPTPVREANPEVPHWLAAIIEKLHAKDPAGRYQSAAQVAELLGQHLAHVQHPSVVPAPPALQRRPCRSRPPFHQHRRWWLAAVAVLLALGGFGLTEATGVTSLAATVIRVFTPEGTLVVEVDDPQVKVTIEGDGGMVITGAGPQEVRLKSGSYRVLAAKDGKAVKEERVSISRGGKQVVKVSVEPAGAAPTAAQAPLAPVEIRRFEGHGTVWSVLFTPSGRQALSGNNDGSVSVWETATGEELRRFERHNQLVRCVAVSPDGRRALSGSDDGTVWLWDVESAEGLRHTEQPQEEIVASVAFSPDGRKAPFGYFHGAIRLWEVESWKELRHWQTPGVWSVCFSTDGRFALSCGGDHLLRLWDVETGKQERGFRGHTGGVWRAVFSADSRQALSAGAEGMAILWDVQTGTEVRRLRGHTSDVVALAFSRDGRWAMSGSGDKTIRVWDLRTGKQLHRLEGHTGTIQSVALSPDDRWALSGSNDGTMRLWELPRHVPPRP